MAAGDRVWINGCLITLAPHLQRLESVDDDDIAVRDGRILLSGRWITPGLIDCHTHLVHAGNCVREHGLKLPAILG